MLGLLQFLFHIVNKAARGICLGKFSVLLNKMLDQCLFNHVLIGALLICTEILLHLLKLVVDKKKIDQVDLLLQVAICLDTAQNRIAFIL